MEKQKVVKLAAIRKMVAKNIEQALIKRPVASVSLVVLCVCVFLCKTGIIGKGSIVLTWISLTLSGLVLLFLYVLFLPKDRMIVGYRISHIGRFYLFY